jgi:hypothetical protein
MLDNFLMSSSICHWSNNTVILYPLPLISRASCFCFNLSEQTV